MIAKHEHTIILISPFKYFPYQNKKSIYTVYGVKMAKVFITVLTTQHLIKRTSHHRCCSQFYNYSIRKYYLK